MSDGMVVICISGAGDQFVPFQDMDNDNISISSSTVGAQKVSTLSFKSVLQMVIAIQVYYGYLKKNSNKL